MSPICDQKCSSPTGSLYDLRGILYSRSRGLPWSDPQLCTELETRRALLLHTSRVSSSRVFQRNVYEPQYVKAFLLLIEGFAFRFLHPNPRSSTPERAEGMQLLRVRTCGIGAAALLPASLEDDCYARGKFWNLVLETCQGRAHQTSVVRVMHACLASLCSNYSCFRHQIPESMSRQRPPRARVAL